MARPPLSRSRSAEDADPPRPRSGVSDPLGPGCRAPHRASASRVSALRASIPIACAIRGLAHRIDRPAATGRIPPKPPPSYRPCAPNHAACASSVSTTPAAATSSTPPYGTSSVVDIERPAQGSQRGTRQRQLRPIAFGTTGGSGPARLPSSQDPPDDGVTKSSRIRYADADPPATSASRMTRIALRSRASVLIRCGSA